MGIYVNPGNQEFCSTDSRELSYSRSLVRVDI